MLTQHGHGLANSSGYTNGRNFGDGSADGNNSRHGNETRIVDKHNETNKNMKGEIIT